MLSVVVPTADRPHRLARTLEALAVAIPRLGVPAEVVVVDDARAPDPVLEALVAEVPGRRLVRSGSGGRSVARNAGAAEARGDRLLFVDGDIVVSPSALDAHASAGAAEGLLRSPLVRCWWYVAVREPTGDVAGPPRLQARLRLAHERGFPSLVSSARRDRFEADLHQLFAVTGPADPRRWVGCTGGCLSIPAATFRRLGGFDEALGRRWGAEDLELGLRVVRDGVPVDQAPGGPVVHLDHPVEHDRHEAHAAALAYVDLKHGSSVGARFADYVAGRSDLRDVGAP